MNEVQSPTMNSGTKLLQSVTEEEAIDGEALGLPMNDIEGGDGNNPRTKGQGGNTTNTPSDVKTRSSKQTRPSYYSGYVPKTPTIGGSTLTTTTTTTVPAPKTQSSTITAETTTSMDNTTESSSPSTPTAIDPITNGGLDIHEVPLRDKSNEVHSYSRQISLISFQSTNGDVNDISSSALAVHADMLLSPEGM